MAAQLVGVLAWGGVSWILAGWSGLLAAALTLGVLGVLGGLGSLTRLRPRTTQLTVAVTGGAATVLCTRGPWGGGGLAGDYAAASSPVQLLLVVCLTAVVASALPVLSALSVPAARRSVRPAHQRDTARRAGSSTSA